jgi:hypothetical protein
MTAKVRILAVTLAKPFVQRIHRASYLGHHPGGEQLHVSAEGNTTHQYKRRQSTAFENTQNAAHAGSVHQRTMHRYSRVTVDGATEHRFNTPIYNAPVNRSQCAAVKCLQSIPCTEVSTPMTENRVLNTILRTHTQHPTKVTRKVTNPYLANTSCALSRYAARLAFLFSRLRVFKWCTAV